MPTKPFKTAPVIKHKKVFIYYMLRRVNNVWEISSPFHKVQAKTLPECWAAINAMEDIDPEVVTAPAKRKSPSRKGKTKTAQARSKTRKSRAE